MVDKIAEGHQASGKDDDDDDDDEEEEDEVSGILMKTLTHEG